MHRKIGFIVFVAAGCLFCLGQQGLFAEESYPLDWGFGRYVFIDGDTDKFQAHHWMPRGYDSGIGEFTIEKEDIGNGVSLLSEGHAFPHNMDFEEVLTLKKEHLGYLKFDYDQFRKYYDSEGGVYRLFGPLRVSDSGRDLHLDIGHFGVEAGLTLKNLPEIVLAYEHEFKKGTKSRLSRGIVKEGSTSRNIAPSWQDIDEEVNIYSVEASHKVAGFELEGEQRWEFFHVSSLREEVNLSTTTVAADKKIRDQLLQPHGSNVTTTLHLKKVLNDKMSVFSGYRFARLKTGEIENITEFNEGREPFTFSSGHSAVNATASNRYDSHTWVGSLNTMLAPHFNVIAKLKSEVFDRHSDSIYPHDVVTNGTPDGIINTTDLSRTENQATRWGEGISLRYTAIPRTALYAEMEFEQVRNWLQEDRESQAGQSVSSANDTFTRETLMFVNRGVFTLGGHVSPCSFADITLQGKYRWNNNDYDNVQHTEPGSSTAKSAFMDYQSIDTAEFSNRLTLRPWRWLQPSLRYQFREDYYVTRIVGNELSLGAEMLSNIYTADLVFLPFSALQITGSYSFQNAWTQTPARLDQLQVPRFDADVATWLASADYAINDKLSLTSTFQYSSTDNFVDFTDIGLPQAAEYRESDVTVGLRWLSKDNLTIEPKYEYHHYKPNGNVEIGGYDAHVVWFEVTVQWA